MVPTISQKRLNELNCVLGLDCSKYQKSINWGKSKAAGIQFAFIKIAEGSNYNELDVYNVKARILEAQKNNIKIGYYHFCRPGNVENPVNDAKDEVNNIKNILNKLPNPNFPIIFDIENFSNNIIWKDKKKEMNIFINTLIGEFDISILYTYKLFFNENTNHTYGMNPLWLAAYLNDPEHNTPTLPLGFNEWKIWQFTEKGQVNGYSGYIDLNIMKREYFDLY